MAKVKRAPLFPRSLAASPSFYLALTSMVVAGCGGGEGKSEGEDPVTREPGFTVSGTAVGVAGAGLTVQLNEAESITLASDGSFTFSTEVADQQRYRVDVISQPSNPTQACSVAGSTGTVNEANVSSVTILCFDEGSPRVATTVVELDAALPAKAVSSIREVVSAQDSAPVGSPLLVATAPEGVPTVIFANNDDGRAVMAAIPGSNTTMLSADSTALAAAFILLGSQYPPMEMPLFLDAVKNAPEYANLVALVGTTIAEGTPFAASADVLLSILTLAQQLPPDISHMSHISETASVLGGVSALLINPGESLNSAQIPYPFVEPSNLFGGVFLAGADGVGNGALKNTQAIDWSAWGSDPTGSRICSGEQCNTLLPGVTISERAVLALAESFGLGSVFARSVEGNADAFYLTVEQTDETRTRNLTQSLQDALRLAISLGTGTTASAQCTGFFLNVALTPSQLSSLLIDRSRANVDAYLSGLRRAFLSQEAASLLLENAEVVRSCFVGLAVQKYNSVVTDILAGMAGVLVSTSGEVYAGANVALKIATTIRFWGAEPVTKGVCLTPGQLFGYNVTSCAADLEVDDLYLAPGASADIGPIKALDSAGSETVPPPLDKLVITPGAPESVYVENARAIVAPGVVAPDAGSLQAPFSVEYPPTAAFDLFVAHVVRPRIVPIIAGPSDSAETLQFPAGASFGLKLIARDGASGEERTLHVPAGTAWSSSDDTLITNSAVNDGNSFWKVDESAPTGSVVEISAFDPSGALYDQVTVNVVAGDGGAYSGTGSVEALGSFNKGQVGSIPYTECNGSSHFSGRWSADVPSEGLGSVSLSWMEIRLEGTCFASDGSSRVMVPATGLTNPVTVNLTREGNKVFGEAVVNGYIDHQGLIYSFVFTLFRVEAEINDGAINGTLSYKESVPPGYVGTGTPYWKYQGEGPLVID